MRKPKVVNLDPRWHAIHARCHINAPTWAFIAHDGKTLRLECAQCGMLVVNLKLKSPLNAPRCCMDDGANCANHGQAVRS